jgi:hypothetical protein
LSGPSPLLLFSLWGFSADLAAAIDTARRHGFAGIEANLQHPALAALSPAAAADQLAAAGQALVLELVTGGDYVPGSTAAPPSTWSSWSANCCGLRPWHRCG